MIRFTIHANGTFWGLFEANNEREAMTAAAEEHGTEGDTSGMTAKPLAEYMADLRESCLGTPIEGHVMAWKNCQHADVDEAGDIWISDPQAGHWLTTDQIADFISWIET